MEDLINNDIQFELFSNSSGASIMDRTLMSYPNEKTSFDVFLGADGDNMFDYSYFEDTEENEKKSEEDKKKSEERKLNSEKLAEGLVATGTAITSVASTVQAFKGDGTKPKSRRKELKEVCGRKPLLKKNRANYDECVAKYNAGKIGNVEPTERTTNDTPPPPPPPPTKDNTKKIIIGVVVIAVVATAFYGYKKGWFGKKAG